MDDDELTKLAVAQLIAEGKKFVQRREPTYTFVEEPTRMRPNLRYFRNTLDHCLSSNNRVERVRKSEAARRLQYLKRERRKRKIEKRERLKKTRSHYIQKRNERTDTLVTEGPSHIQSEVLKDSSDSKVNSGGMTPSSSEGNDELKDKETAHAN